MQYFSGCSGSLTSGVVNRSALANSEDRARREARLGGRGECGGQGRGRWWEKVYLPLCSLSQTQPSQMNQDPVRMAERALRR